MDSRRGTVLNIRVVDGWVMSVSGCKAEHVLLNSQHVHREEDGAVHLWRIKENLQNPFSQSIPMDKSHKDLDVIDLSVPRHAQYLHKAWKRHQDAVFLGRHQSCY